MKGQDLGRCKEFLTRLLLKTIVACAVMVFLSSQARAIEPFKIGYASWYSVESCKKEGTSGIMANGKELKDDLLICASWDYPFGTLLKVTNCRTGKYIIVEVTDRGPNKNLVKKGRIIDLSKRAFSIIAPLEQGVIQVEVRGVN